MLEYPLTDAIPTIDSAKDLLLGRIYRFRTHHVGAAVEERDYALLYAYTLISAQVADELKKVRAEIEGLFGVLNQEELLLEYT